VACSYEWRGTFESSEVAALHGEAFQSGIDHKRETDWKSQVERHSLGWVTARVESELVGFVNVIWDGDAHAWIQDVMVDAASRNHGLGTQLVATACERAKDAGCEWLHVDFGESLGKFYFDACGFEPTTAGIIRLRP
jgi:GNAT superfamily N-acetyltransferase